MYQVTAPSTGQSAHALSDRQRLRWRGPWGEKMDAQRHLKAWWRALRREEPDNAE